MKDYLAVSCDGFEDVHDDRGGYLGEIGDDLEDDHELETGQDSYAHVSIFEWNLHTINKKLLLLLLSLVTQISQYFHAYLIKSFYIFK